SFSDPKLARLDDGRKPTAELPLLHEPGERWTYGASTAVLGRIVEKISGRPLDALLRERIFSPLEMKDTSYAVPADRRVRVVTVHQRQADGGTREQPNPAALGGPVRGDGGLFSTASDYGRFMQLFLNGGRRGGRRLVSESSIRLMMSNQIGPLTVV